mmetsp:Transcript_104782/g.303274  ORF Transcript_104782/g.303274 Transcript_104782/m.303274 type:complete len:259 (-) Transcript_104782:511-1287(-)
MSREEDVLPPVGIWPLPRVDLRHKVHGVLLAPSPGLLLCSTPEPVRGCRVVEVLVLRHPVHVRGAHVARYALFCHLRLADLLGLPLRIAWSVTSSLPAAVHVSRGAAAYGRIVRPSSGATAHGPTEHAPWGAAAAAAAHGRAVVAPARQGRAAEVASLARRLLAAAAVAELEISARVPDLELPPTMWRVPVAHWGVHPIVLIVAVAARGLRRCPAHPVVAVVGVVQGVGLLPVRGPLGVAAALVPRDLRLVTPPVVCC